LWPFLVVLGVAGLKAIIERTLSWKEFILRSAFVAAWFFLGILSLYSNLGTFYMPWQNCYNGIQCHTQQLFLNSQIVLAVFILFVAILIILYYFRKNKISPVCPLSRSKNVIEISRLGLLLIVLLISVDGFRYVYDMQTWKQIPSVTPPIGRFSIPNWEDAFLGFSIFTSPIGLIIIPGLTPFFR